MFQILYLGIKFDQMKIKTIKIKNFKSIGDVGYKACVNNCELLNEKCIDPKENCKLEDWGLVLNCNDGTYGKGLINAFIGKNGSGKSGVFEIISFAFENFRKHYEQNTKVYFPLDLLNSKQNNHKTKIIFDNNRFIEIYYESPYISGKEQWDLRHNFEGKDNIPIYKYLSSNRSMKQYNDELKLIYQCNGQIEYQEKNHSNKQTIFDISKFNNVPPIIDIAIKGNEIGKKRS